MTDRWGLFYGLVAYGWWGLVPIYFRFLRDIVLPMEILSHRVLWSAVALSVVLTLVRRWSDVIAVFRRRGLFLALALSALLIGFNWYIYILSVHLERVVQSSLGYFITPLVSVLLGMMFFREKLRPIQSCALVLACAGVAVLTIQGGELPWIALSLAVTFGFYGLVRKKTPVNGLIGLMIETLVLLPIALAYLGKLEVDGKLTWSDQPAWVIPALILAGPITAVPLICFGQAARRLPLSTLGFLQFLAPSIQLFIAVLAFGEEIPSGGEISFPLIWLSLILFSFDAWKASRRVAAGETSTPESTT